MEKMIEGLKTHANRIRFIADHYSKDSQHRKTMEELRELHMELCLARKINEQPVLPGNTWSEVADVMIMCMQIAYQHGKIEEVLRQMDYKLDRQMMRIRKEQGNESM